MLAESSTSALYAFEPSLTRARLVDVQVREGLADSLAAVLQALADQGTAFSGDELLARVRNERIAPSVFGVYTDLVEAIYADDLASAMRFASDLCRAGFGRAGEFRIVTLADDDLGAGQAERYRRLLDEDPELRMDLRPLSRAELEVASARVMDALNALDAAAPELAGEIRALVREVVLVKTANKSAERFGGASSFHLWGALFLNAADIPNRVEMAEALAHESGHALLFGFSLGRSLVLNDAEQRFSSPLRADPRPMDGVVHATYVLARMHYAVTKLIESNLLSNEERRIAARDRERTARRYTDGLAVIDDHVRWTPPGEAALAAARGYMSEASRA